MWIVAFYVATPCGLVCSYKCFGGKYRLYHFFPEDWFGVFLRNVCNNLQEYVASIKKTTIQTYTVDPTTKFNQNPFSSFEEIFCQTDGRTLIPIINSVLEVTAKINTRYMNRRMFMTVCVCVCYAYVITIVANITLLWDFRPYGVIFVWLYVFVILKLL
jgi:hypothetical protein